MNAGEITVKVLLDFASFETSQTKVVDLLKALEGATERLGPSAKQAGEKELGVS